MSEIPVADDDLEHGFRYYPHRRSGKADPNWKEKLFQEAPHSKLWGRECEENVMEALRTSPLVKILVGALKKAGCPVNLKRNFVCELCSPEVQGGYDVKYNQIVICKNISRSRSSPDATLVSGLIHMYDRCVNKYDHTNLDHLACTEIRAANLTHCSFIGSLSMGQSSFINIKSTHQNCVKYLALCAVMASRKVDMKTAFESVLKVFNKCYNDLEPIGRRCRTNSDEGYLAEEEAKCLFNIAV